MRGSHLVTLLWAVLAVSSPAFSEERPEMNPSPKAEGRRFVRVLEGGSVVHEGLEKTDPSLWRIEKAPFADLKPAGPEGATRKIAILVYPYPLDIAVRGWGFDRGGYVANDLKKNGFRPGEVTLQNTLCEQYKYVFRYDVNRKKVETNFMSDLNEMSVLIDFTEETKKIPNNVILSNNGHFPRDLSPHVARRTSEKLVKDGYSVLDLSPARDELAGKSLAEVMEMVHARHGYDRVLFVPVNAFSKWVVNLGTSIETEIGLLFCYAAVVFERNAAEPAFVFTDNVDLGRTTVGFLVGKQKSFPGGRINFYSEDWSEDRRTKNPDRPVKFYKDGVVDDAWAASVVLGKFSGQALFMVDSMRTVETEGSLFQKLREKGLLIRKPGEAERPAAPSEGNAFVVKRVDLTSARGDVLLRLHPGASVVAAEPAGEQTPVELSVRLHRRDVEEKTETMIRVKKDHPRFAWPSDWTKVKPDNYYRSAGMIGKKEIMLGTEASVVSEDVDFLTVRLKGFVETQALASDAAAAAAKGRISGKVVDDAGPASGVRIGVSGNWANTDENGRYSFEGLEPGREHRLRVTVGQGEKKSTYVNLVNLPVLAPGESLEYPEVNLDALEYASPEEQVAVFSDGYVSEKSGLTALLPRFIPSMGMTDSILSAEMTIQPAKSESASLKEHGISGRRLTR